MIHRENYCMMGCEFEVNHWLERNWMTWRLYTDTTLSSCDIKLIVKSLTQKLLRQHALNENFPDIHRSISKPWVQTTRGLSNTNFWRAGWHWTVTETRNLLNTNRRNCEPSPNMKSWYWDTKSVSNYRQLNWNFNDNRESEKVTGEQPV